MTDVLFEGMNVVSCGARRAVGGRSDYHKWARCFPAGISGNSTRRKE
jgi:hypothetical protein